MSENKGCLIVLISTIVITFVLKYFAGRATAGADLESFYIGFYFELGYVLFIFICIAIVSIFIK